MYIPYVNHEERGSKHSCSYATKRREGLLNRSNGERILWEMSTNKRTWLLLPLGTYCEGYFSDGGVCGYCDTATGKTIAMVILDVIDYYFEDVEENGIKLVRLHVLRKNRNIQSKIETVDNFVWLGSDQRDYLNSDKSRKSGSNSKNEPDYWTLDEPYTENIKDAIESIKKRKEREAKELTAILNQIQVDEPSP